MRYILFVFSLILTVSLEVQAALEDNAAIPSVNLIFSNAYYKSSTNEEAAFWLGTATARCSAAADLAVKLNDGMNSLYGSARKGYFGDETPNYWLDLGKIAENASITMLETSGQSKNDARENFHKITIMSNQLYLHQLRQIGEDDFPNWTMFRADLSDCKAFFSQNKDGSDYRPRPK